MKKVEIAHNTFDLGNEVIKNSEKKIWGDAIFECFFNALHEIVSFSQWEQSMNEHVALDVTINSEINIAGSSYAVIIKVKEQTDYLLEYIIESDVDIYEVSEKVQSIEADDIINSFKNKKLNY